MFLLGKKNIVRLPKLFEILLVYEVLKYAIQHNQQKLWEIFFFFFFEARFSVNFPNHLTGSKASKVILILLTQGIVPET